MTVSTGTALRLEIEPALPLLLAIGEVDSAARPGPDKWCAREVLGHLLDSASINHQRFVRAQFQSDLVFEGYDQEAWVRAQIYSEAPWAELVDFWRAYNLHLARVMDAVPEAVRVRRRARHNLHRVAWQAVPEEETTTLEYFMGDYVGHLRHHLGQIIPE